MGKLLKEWSEQHKLARWSALYHRGLGHHDTADRAQIEAETLAECIHELIEALR